MPHKNIPPGRKWNAAVVSFCIECILRDAAFFHIKLGVLILQIPASCWGFVFLCFYLNGKFISRKTVNYPPLGAFFD